MVDGLHWHVVGFASAAHLAIGRRFRAFHAHTRHATVGIRQHFHRVGIEVQVIALVGRLSLEVSAAVVFHVFRHVADCVKLLDHLASELVISGDLQRLVRQVKVVFVHDQLHTRQFLELAQFLHRELGMSHVTAHEQVEFTAGVGLDAVIHIVGDVGA